MQYGYLSIHSACGTLDLKLPFVLLQASSKLGIAAKNITFGYNYVRQTKRDFQVDRLTYKIVQMALERAVDFCKVKRPLLNLYELLSGTVSLQKYGIRTADLNPPSTSVSGQGLPQSMQSTAPREQMVTLLVKQLNQVCCSTTCFTALETICLALSNACVLSGCFTCNLLLLCHIARADILSHLLSD